MTVYEKLVADYERRLLEDPSIAVWPRPGSDPDILRRDVGRRSGRYERELREAQQMMAAGR